MFKEKSAQVTYLCLVIIFQRIASSTSNLLSNKEVNTYIDVSSQLVLVNNEITLNNLNEEPIGNYLYVVDPHLMNNLSYIEAVDDKKNPLQVNKLLDDSDLLKYDILFKSPLMPGDTTRIHVGCVYTNYLVSYPKKVKQNEKHLVLFSFNVYYFSLYFTEIQTTYLHTGAAQVTYIDGAKYKIPDNNHKLQYGPYFNIDSMSEHSSVVHYENSSPFLTVTNLDRYIQVSHWGYLKIWDHISMVHKGPTFKGPFKRSYRDSPDTRIESYITTLPANAFDIYLKDEIGHLSSFEVDKTNPHVTTVNIRPRFILYGGWKTYYEIGYSLKISDYLRHEKDYYTLTIPITDRIYPQMVIEEATINVILPEGAVFEEISPYVDIVNNTDNYCYMLDILCRKIVSFKYFNLVEKHIHKVSVSYSFSQWLLLLKPIVIAGGFSVIFLTCIIKMHTFSKDPWEVDEEVHEKVTKSTEKKKAAKDTIKQKLKKAKTKKCY